MKHRCRQQRIRPEANNAQIMSAGENIRVFKVVGDFYPYGFSMMSGELELFFLHFPDFFPLLNIFSLWLVQSTDVKPMDMKI